MPVSAPAAPAPQEEGIPGELEAPRAPMPDARLAQAPSRGEATADGAPAPGAPGGGIAANSTGGTDTGSGAPKSLAAPLLIYTANVRLAVFEAPKALDSAETLAKRSGGYLVRRDDTSITVRVPAASFEQTLQALLDLGDVLQRDVSVRDVTEEFYDLQIRIRNAEVVRTRLEELLKRAQRIEEALSVERELARVAGEIERMKGRLKLLGELVTFSTITLHFQARRTDRIDRSVSLPFPWLERLGLGELLRL
jgi:hypothetical protein